MVHDVFKEFCAEGPLSRPTCLEGSRNTYGVSWGYHGDIDGILIWEQTTSLKVR